MAMEQDFEVFGRRQMRATMLELERKVDKGMHKGFVEFGKEVFEESQRLVPVKTGKLKKSGRFEVKRIGRVDIVYSEKYSAAVEFGHRAYTIPSRDIRGWRKGKAIIYKKGKGVPIEVEPGVWRWIVKVPRARPRSYIRAAIENVKTRAKAIYRDNFKEFLRTLRGP